MSRAKAQVKAAAPAAGGTFYGRCETNDNMLSKHQVQINDDLKLITEQNGCTDILTRAGASPAQAPFCATMFNAAMDSGGPGYYRCGGNALWASTKSGPVAPAKTKMDELIKWQFAAPDVVFPETIIIGVFPTTKGPKPTDVSARGSLIRLSPEEPLHAWITVAAESIRNDEGPEQLASWVAMVMAAPLEFRRIPDQKAVFWAQVSERESLGRRFSAMFRTPSGRILEIVHFAEAESRRVKKTLSRDDIAKAWEAHFTSSNLSEKVNFSMVDAAMKVHAGILRDPTAAAIVFGCEDTAIYPQNPWTVFKLVEVVRKSTVANSVDPVRVVELLEGVNFRIRKQSLEAGENTVKGLSGRGMPGNRGLLDLVMMQFNLRTHFLNETLAVLTISDSSKATLRNAFSSFQKFESECEGAAGIAWIGVLEPAAQKFQRLVQAACFSTEMDSAIKRSLRAMQSIPEMLADAPFVDKIQEIIETTPAVPAATAAAASAAPPGGDADQDGNDEDSEGSHPIALLTNLGNNKPDEAKLQNFKSLTRDTKAKIKDYEIEALRIVDIGCQLLTECTTSQELANNMRVTSRAKLEGSPIDGYCLIVYVPRVAGESSTAASTRLPPLRTSSTAPGGNHVRKMLTAAMMMRSPPGENYGIHPGDMFVVSDAGRRSGRH